MTKKLMAYVEVEIRDKRGKVTHYEKREANSLVKNFINLLYIQMVQGSLPGVIDTSGATVTLVNHSDNFYSIVGAAGGTAGIMVGTGTAAVVITDTKLASAIVHGSGAGQLSYLQTTSTTPATVGTTQSFTLSRGFTNLSGSSVSVSEVGIACFANAGSTKVLQIDRTLMSFSVAPGATGTVTYTLQASV